MDDCRDRFLQYIQYEKRFSKHTLIAYSGDLSRFYNYLRSQYGINDLRQADHSVIRSWIVSLMEQKLDPRSVKRKITTLKTFYKFLLRHHFVAENPMLKIQSPKTPRHLPVFIEREKMDKLLDKDDATEAAGNSLRDRLIIELFYGTGMRLSELISLKRNDVDLPAGQLKVKGKRNKERIIPFNNELKRRMEEYLDTRENAGVEYFFTGKSGKKMYEKLVYRIVKTYLSDREVEITGKKSPHVLRHTFATHMLDNGADLNAIKELLGHASLSATQVYTHNTIKKLKNIHRQAHPKA